MGAEECRKGFGLGLAVFFSRQVDESGKDVRLVAGEGLPVHIDIALLLGDPAGRGCLHGQ